ncbi:MAG: energy transducer TonB, partial [Candidatus Lokiarchaeota archaeon]
PEINYEQIFFDGFLDEKKEIVKQVAPVVSGSRRNIMHGQVYVRVIIDKNGRVENAKALRGIDEYYDKISEEAAKKFVFKQKIQSVSWCKTFKLYIYFSD